MVVFGQIIVGPPGVGKTTYCFGMQQITEQVDRKCAIINLDFANDQVPYTPAIDVRDFLTLQTAMDEYDLGPNGGLIFCMESLLENIDWLEEQIQNLIDDSDESLYVIIDCPGQIELFTHHTVIQDIVNKLAKDFDMRLCSVHLLDSFYCTQPATFISASLIVISTMLRLGLPHVNVLSKIDLLKNYGPLPFTLDFFTEMFDLTPLLRYLDGNISELPSTINNEEEYHDEEEEEEKAERSEPNENGRTKLQKQFHAMTASLCEVVNDYNLVSFLPMNIEDLSTVARVLAAIDKANGYSMAESIREYYEEMEKKNNPSSEQSNNDNNNNHQKKPPSNTKKLFQYASEQLESLHEISLEIQEKYGKS